MTSPMSSVGRTAMAEVLAKSHSTAETETESDCSAMTDVLGGTRGGALTATKLAQVVGKTKASSVGMLNTGEEVSPGNGEMASAVGECIKDVNVSTEEEDVRNGEPSCTPNAEVDITILGAAFADQVFLTVGALE